MTLEKIISKRIDKLELKDQKRIEKRMKIITVGLVIGLLIYFIGWLLGG